MVWPSVLWPSERNREVIEVSLALGQKKLFRHEKKKVLETHSIILLSVSLLIILDHPACPPEMTSSPDIQPQADCVLLTC